MLPWVKLALPALLIAGGGTAMIVAGQGEAGQAVATSGVWIDGPTSAVPIGPGAVTVFAHASSASGIDELELVIDGEVISTDADLERNDGLVFAQLDWDAEVGSHELTVRDAADTTLRSDGMLVQVIEGAPVPEASTTTRPGPTTTPPGSTVTTEPGETTTTSTTAPGETTTTGSTTTTTGTPAHPTSPPPTTRPAPPTTVPAPRPVIDAANFVGTPRLYSPPCGYTVGVSARIRDADSATVTVEGTDVRIAMTRSASTFSATIPSGFPPSEVGFHVVTVTANGPGGRAERDVGQLEIRLNCPKD